MILINSKGQNLEKVSHGILLVFEIGSAGRPNLWAVGCVNGFQGRKLTQV
jgi:hypothetical protein